MEPKVIYEDESLLVLDKPSGWVVNKALTTVGMVTVQDWLEKKDYEIARDERLRSGIVHRLDKETSGVLVVAKSERVMLELQTQFKERKVQKTYVCLVHGTLNEKKGVIDAPVGRLPWRRDRFGVIPDGKSAFTSYSMVGEYIKVENLEKGETPYFSLLNAKPRTGRTHQIRVHLKHIGHPVVADAFYAGRKTARRDRKWCPRQFLHAASISFEHPSRGTLVVESDLPEDLDNALATLSVA